MTEKKSLISSKLQQEHDALKEKINAISGKNDEEIPVNSYDEWRLDFMWQLRDFRNQCLKHFDFEELGGFMQDVLNDAPETKNVVEKLELQHTKIVKELDSILDELKALENRDIEKFEPFKIKIRDLIIHLKAHEKAENDLIQKVYSQEYGYPAG